MKVLILNGPNLNLLGTREPKIYGNQSLIDLEKLILKRFSNSASILFKQSNCEGQIIDWIHNAIKESLDAIVINPGAYAHYSIAIHDALKCFQGYKIEVHISNIKEREVFRRTSVTALACDEMICGMGLDGYILAIEQIIQKR